tara:strand:+ start:510 stop:764 length:255 start_codon:yes stop_codon:yes gene_type:complete
MALTIKRETTTIGDQVTAYIQITMGGISIRFELWGDAKDGYTLTFWDSYEGSSGQSGLSGCDLSEAMAELEKRAGDYERHYSGK